MAPHNNLYAFSRSRTQEYTHEKLNFGHIDFESAESVQNSISQIPNTEKIDLVIVATGILHDQTIMPEKTLNDICPESFARIMQVNTLGPMLVAKALKGRWRSSQKTCFCAISARVGSLGDNRLGGWYSYRASKCALNMMLRNYSIEMVRKNPEAIVMGYHPGTVETALSAPFRAHVKNLHTTEFAAQRLLRLIDQATANTHGGRVWDYDGEPVEN